MGISEIFKNEVIKNGWLPTHKHVVLGNLLKHFYEPDSNTKENRFEDEYWIVEQMAKELEVEYSDVIGGGNNGLTVIPKRFQYSKDASISVEGLQQRINNEKKIRKQFDEKVLKKDSEYTEADLKTMQNIVHTYEGDLAEHKVFSALKTLWAGKCGLILHSFKPERFLARLSERSKSQRDGSTDFNFLDLEVKLSDFLQIDTKKEANTIIEAIKQLQPDKPVLEDDEIIELLGKIVKDRKKRKVLESTLKNMSKNIVLDKTLESKQRGVPALQEYKTSYTLEEIEKLISIGLFYSELKPDGECDFLACIKDERMIYIVEVKYERTNESRIAKNLLRDASKQTTRTELYISRIFSRVFNDQWGLAKIVCILPGTFDDEESCNICNNYIITDKKINNMEYHLRQVIPKSSSTPTSTDDECFLTFFELMVCSLSTSSYLSAWKWVVGNKSNQPITAGFTEQSSMLGKGGFGGNKKISNKMISSSQAASSNKVTLHNAMFRSHDATKVLFFSALQLDLLKAPQFLSMILWGDYGTGK